jgi:hypothetical protein
MTGFPAVTTTNPSAALGHGALRGARSAPACAAAQAPYSVARPTSTIASNLGDAQMQAALSG